jgi:cysteine synthase A
MSPGTGGTSATIGRYIRYQGQNSKLLVVDPEHSVFYDYYKSGDKSLQNTQGSNIEGIGRPRVEPSFISGVIDEMLKVNDAQSIEAMFWLSDQLGRKVGPSTGTNFVGVLTLAERMQKANQKGSIVTLLCDSGERYLNSYYDDNWRKSRIGRDEAYRQHLNSMI